MAYLSIIYDMLVLKELRTENNITQEQLAQKIGTNQKTITRWESGISEPSAYYLAKIAKFFHVSVDYLLGLENDLGQKSYVDVESSITPEEQKVIIAYRKLPSASREMILRMLNIETR